MELKNGYSIGEAAKALDIPASTIRYYEKMGSCLTSDELRVASAVSRMRIWIYCA